MRKMGVECTFVSPDCTEEELEAAFQPNTKAVFGESISNPALIVLDFEKFANAAHRHGVPLIVDNTFPTPVNCRPFQYGVDIVTHATTKYMDGHGSCVAAQSWIPATSTGWLMRRNSPDSPRRTTPTMRHLREGIRQGRIHHQGHRAAHARPRPMQNPQAAFFLNSSLESLHVRMPPSL